MARKITIERIAEKLNNKDILYLSTKEKESLAFSDIAMTVSIALTDATEEQILKEGVRNYLLNTKEQSFQLYLSLVFAIKSYVNGNKQAFDSYDLPKEALVYIDDRLSKINEPALLTAFANIPDDHLKALYYNIPFINYLTEWAGAPSKNGKPNVYSIYQAQGIKYFEQIPHSWVNMFRKPLKDASGKKLTKELFFKLFKEIEIKHIEQRIKLYEFDEIIKAYQTIIEELKALTWDIINDRHKSTSKIKVVTPLTKYEKVSRMGHCSVLDSISSLMELNTEALENNKEEVKELAKYTVGNDVITDARVSYMVRIIENEEIKCTRKYVGQFKGFSVFTDKLLLLFRAELCRSFNVNRVHSPAEVSITIQDAMLSLGYSMEDIDNEKTKSNFITKVRAELNGLMLSSFELKTGKKNKFTIVYSFSTSGGVIKVSFAPEILTMIQASHSFEFYVREILKIPNNRVAEYYLARKLVNYQGNTMNIGKGAGNRLSVRAMINELDARRALGADTTSHSERRKIKRFLEALNWLRDNNYIDYELYNGEEGPLLDEEIEQYAQTIEGLELLTSWYVVFDLEKFIAENKEGFRAHYIASAEKAAKTKKARAKREAKKQSQVIEAEVVEVSEDLKAFTV